MDIYDPLAAHFTRVCVCCRRPMMGYSFRTIYGVFVRDNGERVPMCGEPLHVVCPPPGAAPREPYHDPSTVGGQTRPSRRKKHIAKGIDLQPNGRYAARHGKKRLGTWTTVALAQASIDKYLNKQATAPARN